MYEQCNIIYTHRQKKVVYTFRGYFSLLEGSFIYLFNQYIFFCWRVIHSSIHMYTLRHFYNGIAFFTLHLFLPYNRRHCDFSLSPGNCDSWWRFCSRHFIIFDSIIIIDELLVCSFVEYSRRWKRARIEAQWRHDTRLAWDPMEHQMCMVKWQTDLLSTGEIISLALI